MTLSIINNIATSAYSCVSANHLWQMFDSVNVTQLQFLLVHLDLSASKIFHLYSLSMRIHFGILIQLLFYLSSDSLGLSYLSTNKESLNRYLSSQHRLSVSVSLSLPSLSVTTASPVVTRDHGDKSKSGVFQLFSPWDNFLKPIF
jgi:hypothetical protein